MDLSKLEAALGYRFRHQAFLRLALTHPSCGPQNNQRLEFLGDAVLQLAMSDIVFHAHPEEEEGGMTFLRARMVREETLCAVARHLNLGAYMRMDHGCEMTGGRQRPAVLADAMEAVLAAVYLDAGFDEAARIVRALWPREQEVSLPVTDTGLFTSISAEEKATAFAEAQANMSESAGKDQVLLGQAKENAKELIKQYVVNIGKMKNKDY